MVVYFLRSLEFEHGMLVEREDRVKRIEDDVLDINQIMSELGALVHIQGDAIGKSEEIFYFTIFKYLYLSILVFFIFYWW